MKWIPQTSFRNGEISPKLDGMSNEKVYGASCRKLEGAIVSSSGTVEKRGGTAFVADTSFSTTDNSSTYESTAVKLIPFTSGLDVFTLVFEVMTDDSDPADSWGVIRAIVNNTLSTAAWKTFASSNLPFRALTWSTSNNEQYGFYPPGTHDNGTNSHTDTFGLHNFTAVQVPELQYFQHEDALTVMHPDAMPIQVYTETSSSGAVSLNTRPYPCKGFSPSVKRYGDRFTMTVTATEEATGEYTVETTRDWFDDNDLNAIYRIGHCGTQPTPGYYDQTVNSPILNSTAFRYRDDTRGFFVIVSSIQGPRKATVKAISDTTPHNSGSPEYDVIPEVSDPYDWDGPWVKDDSLTVTYGHGNPPNDLGVGGTSVAVSGAYQPGQSPIQVVVQNAMVSPDSVTQHQLIGNIITKQGSGSGLGKEVHAVMAFSNTEDGLLPSFSSSAIYSYMLTGAANTHSSTNPSWQQTNATVSAAPVYRLRDKDGELLPTITMSKQWDTFSDDIDGVWPGLYPIIEKGDKVFLYIGNVDDSSIFEHIPKDHDNFFDCVTRGNVAVPENNKVDVGGVVHINGGSFALQSKQDNCYISYCIRPPIHQSVTSKYDLGWSKAVGFPGAGSSHQGRVVFSGFKGAGQVVVGSAPDNPKDFGLGGTSADGFHFIVNDLRGSRVRWVASGKDLLIGTSTGEFSVTGSPLSAISVGVDRQSAYGSSSVRPVIAGTQLLFVQKDKKTLRAMRFNFDNQRYVSKNITQEHTHFFKSATIEELIVWEGEEDPVVMVRLSDGEVLACRVNEIEGFYGWSRMKMPICSSITPSRNYTPNLTGSATTGDDFYVAIDGTGKYTLARYDNTVLLDEYESVSEVDSAISVTLASDRFDGQTVSVVLDDIYKGEVEVSGATIDISKFSTSANTAVIGKKISMAMQPRVPEVAASPRSQSTLGRVKNYSSVVVNFSESQGVKVNGHEADLDFTTNSSQVPTVLTGWHETPVVGLYGIQPLLELTSDRPYPVEITALTIDVSVEG